MGDKEKLEYIDNFLAELKRRMIESEEFETQYVFGDGSARDTITIKLNGGAD